MLSSQFTFGTKSVSMNSDKNTEKMMTLEVKKFTLISSDALDDQVMQ